MDRIFLDIEGTCKTLEKVKILDRVVREKEPVFAIGRDEPSPITMLFEASYGPCKERLLRSFVTWWDAPLSRS